MPGPEDSKAWWAKDNFTWVQVDCSACKQKIILRHCDERGCPWCRNCGLRAKAPKP